LRKDVAKLMTVLTARKLSPLHSAVDQGNFEVFKLIRDIAVYLDINVIESQKKHKLILEQVLHVPDEKHEVMILKAGRL